MWVFVHGGGGCIVTVVDFFFFGVCVCCHCGGLFDFLSCRYVSGEFFIDFLCCFVSVVVDYLCCRGFFCIAVVVVDYLIICVFVGFLW